MMPDHSDELVPVYLVIDTSGSTVRNRWIDCCNSVVPQVVEGLGSPGFLEGIPLLGVVAFGTTAELQTPLTRTTEIEMLPALSPGGFTSLSAAMDLLCELLPADLAQIEADGLISMSVATVMLLGGLPTDNGATLRRSRQALTNACPILRTAAVVPYGTDHLPLYGLSVSVVTSSAGASHLANDIPNSIQVVTGPRRLGNRGDPDGADRG